MDGMHQGSLGQSEVTELINVEKICEKPDEVMQPPSELRGRVAECALKSVDGKDGFIFSMRAGNTSVSVNLLTNNYLIRSSEWHVSLVRIDLKSRSHRNPDGTKVGPDHVHIYDAVRLDKQAYPLSVLSPALSGSSSMEEILHGLWKFCNVTRPPRIILSLLDSLPPQGE